MLYIIKMIKIHHTERNHIWINRITIWEISSSTAMLSPSRISIITDRIHTSIRHLIRHLILSMLLKLSHSISNHNISSHSISSLNISSHIRIHSTIMLLFRKIL